MPDFNRLVHEFLLTFMSLLESQSSPRCTSTISIWTKFPSQSENDGEYIFIISYPFLDISRHLSTLSILIFVINLMNVHVLRIATSEAWERQLGEQESKNILKQYQGKILPNTHRATITTHRVGKRIAQAAQQFAQEHNLKGFDASKTKITVVRSEAANAFVLPNNHIFVLTGLFDYVKNEDDLAAVLGHEMSHSLARHVGEKISGSFVSNALMRLSLLVDPSGLLLTVFLPASSLFRDLPHSRVQELEADRIGLQLAALACYDPRAAKRVFARMNDGIKGAPPEFLSTHPSHGSRVDKLDEWMPEALKLVENDGGERCRRIRQDMAKAREVAARQALAREAGQQQKYK